MYVLANCTDLDGAIPVLNTTKNRLIKFSSLFIVGFIYLTEKKKKIRDESDAVAVVGCRQQQGSASDLL